MPTPLRWAVAGYLFLIFQWTSVAVEITERRFVAEGSSVLLYAPDIKNINFTEWEFIRNTTPEFILQYYADSQSPTIYPAYQGRVIFYPENGSLLLQKLQEIDSGVYKATVDLKQDKARTTLLEVIKPVPQPELQCSSSLVGSPIELRCVLPKGRVDAIFWKKEGRPLPPERCYQLSENMTVLRIGKGEKADCGSYSCNVSNEISWKEAVLNLTLAGLLPPLHHAQRMAALVLVFAAGSAIGFAVLLRQPEEQGLGKKVERWMTVSIQGLLCFSSLLLLATSIIWMQQEGPSAAFILLGLFLFATIITTALLTATLSCRPAALIHLRTKKWHRVILDTATPTTVIILMLFASLLLQNIQQLHERGCSEPIDLTASFVIAATVVLFVLLVFLWYHRNKKKETKMENLRVTHITQGMTTSVQEELRGQNQEEE
ncbi:uncharacterized protein LOC112987765 isoform X2 [Dromaius novaehollandiae]|uniref:uncharacterized protein LOC112987765 isoform X2 n=1 Tax=Dromaius novaehollandiae TaxID=8790 RepID=UPI00311F4D2A